jgi:hypothetical protein
MPLYESTLRFIDLASSDTEEEHSSQHNCVGENIIDLTGFDLEEEHAPEEEEIMLARRREAEASVSSGHFTDDANASGSEEGIDVDDA